MGIYENDINEIIKEDFLEYAGHVMQERSIPDARDGLKDGARKILYIQYKDKNTHNKNFIKGGAAVGQALKMGYLHGDASAYGTIVRLGKKFACPYVLEELQGNGGNQVSPDNHASMRYLELRQSELASYLFASIEKNTIDEWYDNYANTMQLPRVLPTIGFYPIVNGTSGIAVGLSTSIPPTNLKEVNTAIIKLIKNPKIDFDEIYCPPDFPMGGVITNGVEVKNSMREGYGKAIRSRAKIEYIPNKHMLVATEIPFSVYTDTIDNELAELINSEENPGIEKYIDATNDDGAKINIYLSKSANVNKIINLLYKKTSLESHYSINIIMLENGRFPKVFGWRECLLGYIAHIRQCKNREIQFDLDKALARKNIVDGLIKAYSIIDEVVALIRASSTPAEASAQLINKFDFNEEQAKAILAMKLSSLTKLDIVKLEEEAAELSRKIEWCHYLLNTPAALDEELIKTLKEVADKFGDERRTKIENSLGDEEEPEEIKEEDVIALNNGSTIKVVPKEATRGKRAKAQLEIYTTNLSSLVCITDTGTMYTAPINKIKYNKEYQLTEVFENFSGKPLTLIDNNSFNAYKTLTCITKHGYIKRSSIQEYNIRAKKGAPVIKLEENDSLVTVVLSADDDDKVIIISNNNYYNYYSLKEINCTGRTTKGVKAIKLDKDGFVKEARCANDNIYKITGRAVKGVKYE